ncbi:MAG: hypothetical protein ACI8RD_011768, partial [Bacillariaceae sp.]
VRAKPRALRFIFNLSFSFHYSSTIRNPMRTD